MTTRTIIIDTTMKDFSSQKSKLDALAKKAKTDKNTHCLTVTRKEFNGSSSTEYRLTITEEKKE